MLNQEKIKAVLDQNWSSPDQRNEVLVYLNALRTNNEPVIKEFEKFGSCPYKMIYNKLRFEYRKMSWDNLYFNKNGYIEQKQLSMF